MMKRILTGMLVSGLFLAGAAVAEASGPCSGLPNASQLHGFLVAAATGTGVSGPLGPGTSAGGLFGGARMWGAVVNRDGELCLFVTSTADATQVWPGSQAIAKAKAYTANAFSLDALALSTARLYTFVQPGHSLFGLNDSNVFNAEFLVPSAEGRRMRQAGKIAGGVITFGGGVPLYDSGGLIIGGLGVSGDTACADHEVAKRVRDLAGLNPPGGPLVDDIVYTSVDGSSVFGHPVCLGTLRNGISIGSETPAP